MVRLTKIYTRTGDDGTTGLAAGPRRKKADVRMAAIGDVDETNAAIGLARLQEALSKQLLAEDERITEELRVKESDRIQVMADGLQALGVKAFPPSALKRV